MCIFASGVPNPNITVEGDMVTVEGRRKKRQAVDMGDAILHVLVTVEDMNDNNPEFQGGFGPGNLLRACKST